MSRTVRILIGVLVGLIVVGICIIGILFVMRALSGDEATPTAIAPVSPEVTAPPGASATPEGTADNSWDKVQAAGTMLVGTSADYPPFEYYVGDYQIDGFDIALMDEIGRRLNVQVQYRDFAFDGLGNALMLKEIDSAIAAVSVTSEREGSVDFSNVYFVGQDAVLAREGSGITLNTVDDLATYKVGVQSGSVYEDWLREELVATGKMPSGNLFTYQRAEDAVRDLKEQRIALVVLDAQPAEVALSTGGIEVIKEGMNQQRFAIAFPKGAHALRDKINEVLTALHNEGFINQLAKQYLDLEELLPTPTPAPTSTPAPPPACIDGMIFVKDVGDVGQGPTEMQPGQPFTKIWQVKNTGTCTWDSSYLVDYVSGNVSAARMNGQPTAIQGQVAPGQTYDLAVGMVAPLQAGDYRAFWQLENGQGAGFGDRLRVAVNVLAAPTVTPAPTQTPVPGIVFTVDRTNIKQGECVTFYWKVDNVKSVYFYREGERWQDNGVTGEESRQECPPATTTYYLRVVMPDDSVEVRQITIYVEPVAGAPNITRFTVDPPNQITLDQCVTIRWEVQGQVDRVTIKANDAVLWDYAPTAGSHQDCPANVGNMAYIIEATGPGGTSRGQQNINVVGPATATPQPTAAPDAPVIYTFSVMPEQVAVGDCVNISWSTGGGTTWVNIYKNEDTVWDNAPHSGSMQDCPGAAGSVLYGVKAYNAVDDSVFLEQTIQVTE